MSTRNYIAGKRTRKENCETTVDHWESGCYDDQSIHYRIADLLEEILEKLKAAEISAKEGK